MASQRDEEQPIGHTEPWFPRYSFLNQVAAEARLLREKYWAKGGAADKAAPVQRNPGWFQKRDVK
jgi:hypothetical protein